MRGTVVKKLRRLARERDKQILPELKEFINGQGLGTRFKIAFNIIRGKF